MDILRQELNEIYSRQHLESEVLSDDERLKAIKLTVTDGTVTLGKCQGNVAVMVRR